MGLLHHRFGVFHGLEQDIPVANIDLSAVPDGLRVELGRKDITSEGFKEVLKLLGSDVLVNVFDIKVGGQFFLGRDVLEVLNLWPHHNLLSVDLPSIELGDGLFC